MLRMHTIDCPGTRHTSPVRGLFVGVLLLGLGCPALGQDNQAGRPIVQVGVDTWQVECDYGTAEKAWLARSNTLVSPDEENRAYVEVEVVQLESRLGVDCRNTSKLLLSTPRNPEFKIRYMEEPTACAGNGIRLVDWSKDGKTLLAQINNWIYESDACEGGDILLYKKSSERFSLFTAGRINKWITRRLGRNCTVTISAVGFSEDGKIVLDASEHWSNEVPCLNQETRWLLHPRQWEINSISSDFTVKRYAKVDQSKPKE